jgi:protein O-GlcNAc transferase
LIGKHDMIDRLVAAGQTVVSQRPEDAGAWVRLGLALGQQGDLDGELAAYRQAITLEPPPSIRSEAYARLGDVLTRKGAWQEAIQAYQTLVELRPDDRHSQYRLSEAHRQLGLSFIEQGELERAIHELRLTLRLNSTDEQAREALNSVLLLKDTHRN